MSKTSGTNIDSRTAAFDAESSSNNHLSSASGNPFNILANSPALPSDDGEASDSDGSVFYEPGTADPRRPSTHNLPVSTYQLSQSTSNTMVKGFGTNRLAAGFGGYKAAPIEESLSPGAQEDPIDLMSSPENSADQAIEITDDEGSESGGMLLNLDNSANSHFHAPSRDGSEASESQEEGQIKSTPSDDGSGMATQSLANLQRHIQNAVLPDSNSDTQSFTRLMDLSPAEQELQIRYVFYEQDESCIDMTSPARLEKATQQLERQAANRGLRPDNLRIRGRAGTYQAGRYTRLDTEEEEDDDDSEDEFIRPTVAPQRPLQSRIAPLERPSQDRRPQPGQNPRRPANDWYSTNSFGQRRSQSPRPPAESRRRVMPDSQRSRSPRRFDGNQSGRRRSPTPRSDNGGSRKPSPPNSRRSGPGRDNLAKSGTSTDLPVRRASQTNIEHPLPVKPPAVAAPPAPAVASATSAAVGQSQKSTPSSSGNDTAGTKRRRRRQFAKASAAAAQKK
ncbi:hypothetical protein B0A52_09874 [Exophiala mesophila]|uniref:Uncharacterized protein n=1 Tax=Exophiala mesophila TaxID=212818 RepID=A0A438MRA1_EXOME|nr:hypothetical protein B0A52_09874 [Exophiala mesophila]